MRNPLLTASLCAFSVGLASAQNDECNAAIALTLGQATPFDTASATTSFVWPCAAGGNDVWFRVTPPTAGLLAVSTCGSGYDTAVEIFSGNCASLVSLACNDDSCSLQSFLSIPSVGATTYLIRVGGHMGLTGSGTIRVDHTPPPVNDECSGAIAVQNGASTPFDTSSATTSSPWPCAFGANDIWFRYVALTQGASLSIETCGSLFDTALEVFSGTCGSLTSLACNDDQCSVQSQIQLQDIVAGNTYLIRVGGFFDQAGPGTLAVLEGPPPSNDCVQNPSFETGSFAGWTASSLFSMSYPLRVVGAGQSPGFGSFVSAPTEGSFAAVHGFGGGGPGVIRLSQEVMVTPGLTPLTFDYRAAWDLSSFPGFIGDREFDVVVRHPVTGVVLQSSHMLTAAASTSVLDTGPISDYVDLSLFIGQTVRLSFEWTIPDFYTGPGFFQLDNISCPAGGGAIGTNYCSSNPNSTGVPSLLRATGSTFVSANAVRLVAERLPTNTFGYFLTSTTQGLVSNPGGSAGILCLGGQIGRYTGPGQVQNSGSTGVISLVLDLTQTPSPTGFVAVMVGESRRFQGWHRDSLPGGPLTSNFTNGLRVNFN